MALRQNFCLILLAAISDCSTAAKVLTIDNYVTEYDFKNGQTVRSCSANSGFINKQEHSNSRKQCFEGTILVTSVQEKKRNAEESFLLYNEH